jgi:hypothetical protein
MTIVAATGDTEDGVVVDTAVMVMKVIETITTVVVVVEGVEVAVAVAEGVVEVFLVEWWEINGVAEAHGSSDTSLGLIWIKRFPLAKRRMIHPDPTRYFHTLLLIQIRITYVVYVYLVLRNAVVKGPWLGKTSSSWINPRIPCLGSLW